jgi:hypothetical protein
MEVKEAEVKKSRLIFIDEEMIRRIQHGNTPLAQVLVLELVTQVKRIADAIGGITDGLGVLAASVENAADSIDDNKFGSPPARASRRRSPMKEARTSRKSTRKRARICPG